MEKNRCPFEFPPFENIRDEATEEAEDSSWYGESDTTVEEQYGNTQSMLQEVCKTKKVYRGLMEDDPVAFARKVSNDQHYDFGNHWSADMQTALSEFGYGVVLEARIDPKDIDFLFTIHENFSYPDESEVYFRPKALGKLISVHYEDREGKTKIKRIKNSTVSIGE